jgi:hypothetical protein
LALRQPGPAASDGPKARPAGRFDQKRQVAAEGDLASEAKELHAEAKEAPLPSQRNVRFPHLRPVAYAIGGRRPNASETINRTKKTKNKTLAMVIAMPSSPQKPKRPAINAMTKKVKVHCNMIVPFLF